MDFVRSYPAIESVFGNRFKAFSNHEIRFRACGVRCAAQTEVAVLGGGAAGLTAAFFAAQSGARVTVFEKNEECGKKILVSGGKRCNILPGGNIDVVSDYFSESKQGALKSIFSRWSLKECQQWIERDLQINLVLDQDTNKLFPSSNSSADVRNSLLRACENLGARIVYRHDVQDVERDSKGKWTCHFKSSDEQVAFDKVILATGGKSYASLGTTGRGYTIAEQLGHTIVPVYPALTPLKGRPPGTEQLAGVSLSDIGLSVHLRKQDGKRMKPIHSKRSDFLITHRGFSGPSVMDLSHYVTMALERDIEAPEMCISWAQGVNETQWESCFMNAARAGTTRVTSIMKQYGIPARLAASLCEYCGIPVDRVIAELKKKERVQLVQVLTQHQLEIHGHEGYPKAEVTGGGVPLKEIDCKTMESLLAPGIYIVGELLDVHGRIGGFNFLWAFTTARLAGISATIP